MYKATGWQQVWVQAAAMPEARFRTGNTVTPTHLLAALIQLTWSEGDEWAPCCSDRQDACQVNQVCTPASNYSFSGIPAWTSARSRSSAVQHALAWLHTQLQYIEIRAALLTVLRGNGTRCTGR